MRGRVLAWTGGAVAVAAAVGLVAYVAVAGLDQANKLAGVAGVLIGLAGLLLSAYGMVLDRRAEPVGPPGGQHVTGSTVGGDLTQVKDVTGSVRIGRRATLPPGPPAPAPSPVTATSQGQSVDGSQVGGDVTQVEGVGGDAEIDR
jgi:hypothetical protein